MRGGRALVFLGAVWLAWLGPAEVPARAAAFTVTLQYDASAGCPDAADFKAIVVARLGYDPFSESASDHVLVRMASRDGSLDGRIEWRDAAGKWAGDQSFPLVSTDCLQLTRAMGFALALQIQFLAKTGAAPGDVGARVEGAPPGGSPTPQPMPTATPPVIAAPAAQSSVAAAPDRLRRVFAMGAGPSAGFGMSSTPILLGRVFAALAWPHASIELAAAVSVPSTTRRTDGGGFSQQHLLLSAASCAAVSRWNACLLVNAGEVRMIGQDVDRPSSAVAPVVEAGARLGVTQPLGPRLFVAAHADGLAILTRWIGRLDGVPVWTAPRFAGAVGVDTGVRFP